MEKDSLIIITDDTTSCTNSTQPVKAIGRGFCFDCDHPVKIEYDQFWVGEYAPPKTCLECGGHDVEFMGRVAERLWERAQFKQALGESLEMLRLADELLSKM